MLNVCLCICSLYELAKCIKNDKEYNKNGYEYGFMKIRQTSSSCNSITKYQNIYLVFPKSHSLKHIVVVYSILLKFVERRTTLIGD